jgi:hypothetical protein
MTNGGFGRFFARVAACHMATYFLAGIGALVFLDYAALFRSEALACFMKPVDSPGVALGPGLQWIRGLVFAAALYPFRETFLQPSRGWLKLWGLLLGLAVFSTAGPAPGSIEGLIYTKVPILDQLRGLPEAVSQTLAFSWLLVAWHRRPHRAWGIVLYGLAALVILMSVAGALVPRPPQVP